MADPTATFSFSVTMPGQEPMVATAQVPVPDVVRTLAAFQQDANTRVNGTATTTQVVEEMRNQYVAYVDAKVTAFEQQQAVAALPTPTPLNVTVD